MTPAGRPRKACNDAGLHVYATTYDSQMGINRPPVIPAVEIPQTRFPPRIAGRCGPAGGAFRPPAFILLHFRPHVSPQFFGKDRPLKQTMEPVKFIGIRKSITEEREYDTLNQNVRILLERSEDVVLPKESPNKRNN